MGDSEGLGEWSQIALPSHLELEDGEKKKLEHEVGESLRSVTEEDPDELMIEYLVVMILNGKNFAETTTSMAELLGMENSKKLCEDVARKLEKLIAEIESNRKDAYKKKESITQDREGLAQASGGEKKSQSKGPPLTTKELRERRIKRQEEERMREQERGHGRKRERYERNNNSEKAQLAQAYKLYLQSGYAGSFQEYQDYLKGITNNAPEKEQVKDDKEPVGKKVKAMTWKRPGFEAPEVKIPEKPADKGPKKPALTFEERQTKLKSMSWSRVEKKPESSPASNTVSAEIDSKPGDIASEKDSVPVSSGRGGYRGRGNYRGRGYSSGYRGRGTGFRGRGRGRGRGRAISGGFQHKTWVRPGTQAASATDNKAQSEALSSSLPKTP